MNIIDYHIHSNNSFDGMDSIKSICNKAIEKKISEICFTEHFSVDPTDVSYNVLNYKKYHSEIKKCQQIFNGKLIIREGLEIGEPHLKNLKQDLIRELKEMDLDFIIGSIHNINTLKLRSYMIGRSKDKIYGDYFKEISNLVKESDIDVVGHLDLMKRYAFNCFGNYNFKDYEENLRIILSEIIKRNIGIEINTSGLRSSVEEIFPSIEVIRLYKELGGEIITIGSDAHNIEDIGKGCHTALEILRFLEFKYLFRFEKRKPLAISIK